MDSDFPWLLVRQRRKPYFIIAAFRLETRARDYCRWANEGKMTWKVINVKELD